MFASVVGLTAPPGLPQVGQALALPAVDCGSRPAKAIAWAHITRWGQRVSQPGWRGKTRSSNGDGSSWQGERWEQGCCTHMEWAGRVSHGGGHVGTGGQTDGREEQMGLSLVSTFYLIIIFPREEGEADPEQGARRRGRGLGAPSASESCHPLPRPFLPPPSLRPTLPPPSLEALDQVACRVYWTLRG